MRVSNVNLSISSIYLQVSLVLVWLIGAGGLRDVEGAKLGVSGSGIPAIRFEFLRIVACIFNGVIFVCAAVITVDEHRLVSIKLSRCDQSATDPFVMFT